MVKRVFTIFLGIMVLSSFTLAFAGGAPQAPAPYAAPCPPGKAYPMGPECAFWGDAPFPGLCGGVVALPFLVVGSLLGGNTMGPVPCPPAPAYPCAPKPYPAKIYAPPAAAPCGPAPYGPAAYGPYDGSLFSALPVFDLCSGLLGGVTGGPSLLW